MTQVNCGTRALDAYTRLMELFTAPRLANLTDIDQMDRDDYREIATQMQDLFWYIKDCVESHPMVSVYNGDVKYHTNFVYADFEYVFSISGVSGLRTYLQSARFYTFTNKSVICNWKGLDHIINWIMWQYCDYKKNPIYDAAFQSYAERNLEMALDNGSALTEKYTAFHIEDNILCAFLRESSVAIF
jgi:hypothetical protein